jgi:hypothetical protein
MREKIGALLDQGLRVSSIPDEAEDSREATQISNHVQELGNGVHGIVFAPVTAVVAAAPGVWRRRQRTSGP